MVYIEIYFIFAKPVKRRNYFNFKHMSVQRDQPPKYTFPKGINIPEGVYGKLDNDIPLLYIHNPSNQLIRLDLRLRIGSMDSVKTGVCAATAKTLFEGTSQHHRDEIYESIDYLGAYLNVSADKDFTSICIHFPKQCSRELFRILEEVITSPAFPEQELQIFKEKQKEALRVNREKTSFTAFRTFSKTAFKSHPYGCFSEENDYDAINRKDVYDFYTSHYHAGNMRLFLAGNIDDEIISLLNKTFGSLQKKENSVFLNTLLTDSPEKILISKDSALQSSIIIGKKLFTRTHADWMKFSLLNMILGGYFGSRLMSDIREKKGLAYGIYSRMQSYLQAGLFYIAADVNVEKTQQAVDAIYASLDVLSKELVTKDELSLVKNYYQGMMLRNFDGIFQVLERYIETDDYGLTQDYWQDFFEIIRSTDAEELLSLAKKYLHPASMIEVVVGEK